MMHKGTFPRAAILVFHRAETLRAEKIARYRTLTVYYGVVWLEKYKFHLNSGGNAALMKALVAEQELVGLKHATNDVYED